MMPQNAPAALSSEAAGAFPAPECAMANAAEALSLTSASAIGFQPSGAAIITARRRHNPDFGAPGEISMSMRMLIDARHPEETRVAVVKGNRIEEFDFESAEHKQLKGNIYLAKVTRVEPSLQAAFIDYGGNRHGFLAFSEIHPDYYQIPKADREALLREEAEHAAEEERLRAAEYDDEDDDDASKPPITATKPTTEHAGRRSRTAMTTIDAVAATGTESNRSPVDESAADELRQKRQALRRRYKIQDVIQRRQVLLVQVVKEERGNKGAALTTYLSLAGRYCVLMPNTSHGGGI